MASKSLPVICSRLYATPGLAVRAVLFWRPSLRRPGCCQKCNFWLQGTCSQGALLSFLCL